MRNKYLVGTYGWDLLSKVLFIAAIPLATSKFTVIFGAAIMIYAVWRTMSRNLEQRNKEEIVFEDWLRTIKYKCERLNINCRNSIQKIKEKRKYVITTCPNCSQKLRLPRHKGKIVVTCKRCSHEFKIKT